MKQRQVGTIVILYPEGHLTSGEATAALEREFEELGKIGNRRLIVNLSEAEDLDSVALRILASAHADYVRRGGQIKLCGVDKRIQSILVLTKLAMLFDIFATEEQAMGGPDETGSVSRT